MASFNIFHGLTIMVSYAAFFFSAVSAILYLVQDSAIKRKLKGAVFNRLPSLSFLDRFNYRSICLGFPILTVSILAGFIRAKYMYGVYWHGCNPRHIYALMLWLIYAAILHVRLLAHLRGRKVALLSAAAFFVCVLTLFGTCH